MSNLQENTHTTSIVTNQNKGHHYELIKNSVSDALKNTSSRRALSLSATPAKIESWYNNTGQDTLKSANLEAWKAQNEADQQFGKIQDIYSFAEPLLRAKLKEKYKIDEDVNSTFLRLYFPADKPWYNINIQPGYVSRTVSLLDAALHNFASSETFTSDSDFISKPDANGHFDIKPIRKKMSIEQFKTLCRELDIGARYNRYLKEFLLPSDGVAKAVLENRATTSQKTALKAAAHMALMKKDITENAHGVVLGMIDGQQGLTLDGKVMQCCEFSIMDATLTGIVVFTAVAQQRRGTDRLIAYVPHDPEHPLKEYTSGLEFVQELTRQLQDNKPIASTQGNYWQFFSQFVDQQQRGHFFAELEQRLSTIKWHEKDPLEQGPSWRSTPVEKPYLEFRVTPIKLDLWVHLYQAKINKIINDAREIAVPTAKTDSDARWVWWDNFKKMLSDIFNAALLVITPFVPGLGELMMAYTVYQLTTEVIEGVVDMAEGLWTEFAEHVVGVVTDVIQLAAFAAGTKIGNEFRLKLSPVVDGMKPVTSPDGKTRLWHPDLKPYEQQNLQLPTTSKPDALGLHQHAGKNILPLEGKHYEVKHDPASGLHRIQHPTRPQAYAPELRHNGQGAWVHEGEKPQAWEGQPLMRRLGHSVDGYTNTELQNLRTISGTSDDSLRRMHVENAAPPPLLTDTLTRFKTWDEARNVGQLIRSGQPLDPASYWFERMVPDMPGWPADKALKVYENADLTGGFRKYGNPDAPEERTLSIGLADMMAGKLPEHLVAFLGDAEMQALLGKDYPKGERVQALRDQLADSVETRTPDIFSYQYQLKNHSGDAQGQLLQRQYPELPSAVAESLVAKATPAEIKVMAEEQRIPLRLKNQARESAFEIQAARAYEGFHEPALLVPDTERLALNALKLHTDTYADLRLEVRDGTYDGPLRCSAGSEEAATVRVLIRDEHGRYEVHDGTNNKLHEANDFYEAVLRALPDDKRLALGYRVNQGDMFKEWVMVKTEPPAERRTLLARPPIRPVVPRETELLLRGGGLSKGASTVEEKVKNLYPHFDENEVAALSRSLHTKGDPHLEIERLELELQTLKQKLENWEHRYLGGYAPLGLDEAVQSYWEYKQKGGQFIAERLIDCFERKSEVFGTRSASLEGGYSLDLSQKSAVPHDLEHWWSQLPDALKPYLDQVVTLNLDGSRITPGPRGMLKDFPHIRQFSARGCGLTALPDSIANMRLLETLRLSDNSVRLTPSAVEQLRNLTRLETLRLDGNPLGALPNIERMPRLKQLNLARTGVDTWPPGLFSKARPQNFFLDLRLNPIASIPDVIPGSDSARLIARTRVDAQQLSDENRTAYERYRTSVGLSPEFVYSPATDELVNMWPVVEDNTLYSNSPGIGAYREETWHDLASEPNSDGFFSVLKDLTRSADYLQGGSPRRQLTDRVWRMVGATGVDTQLREELFLMSTNPEGCADAGAQLFNNMGMKVLASEARSSSTNRVELERKLVTLAKGSARLGQVSEIARADIKARSGNPDEVEVHLAYETGLAKRLELPWQSEAMAFRPVAGVSEETIDVAFDTVIERETGDGLVNQMIEQPFWEQYLRETYPGEIEANTRIYQDKFDQLEELRSAQDAWAEAADLLEDQKIPRRQKLRELAQQLSIVEDVVFTGQVMTNDVYEGLLNDIGYQEKELSRRLTREAMVRAGL